MKKEFMEWVIFHNKETLKTMLQVHRDKMALSGTSSRNFNLFK